MDRNATPEIAQINSQNTFDDAGQTDKRFEIRAFKPNALVAKKKPDFYRFLSKVIADNEQALKAAARRAFVYKPTIERNVWLFWYQGWEQAPEICKLCRQSWENFNQDWMVHALSASDCERELKDLSFIHEIQTSAHMQLIADALRLRLLRTKGGVWCDATLFCTRPLTEWLFFFTNSSPIFLFSFKPGHDRSIANWFIVGSPGSALLAVWNTLHEAYLRALASTGTPLHAYRAHHFTFDVARQIMQATAAEWAAMPKIWANKALDCNLLLTTASSRNSGLHEELQADASNQASSGRQRPRAADDQLQIRLRMIPVHKLSWKHPAFITPLPSGRNLQGKLERYVFEKNVMNIGRGGNTGNMPCPTIASNPLPSLVPAKQVLRDNFRARSRFLKELDQISLLIRCQALGEAKTLTFPYDDKLIHMYLPFCQFDRVQQIIVRTGSFHEIKLLEFARTLIKPDAIILDIGANIGNHSIFFAKICGAAKVHAFEPMRVTFEILKKNIELNGLADRIFAHNVALGSEERQADIKHYNPLNIGASSVSFERHGAYAVRPLDSFGIKRVDFMKIDVEGSHIEVLSGARKTLERCKPTIWIELRPEKNEVQSGLELMQNLGYSYVGLVGDSKQNHLFRPR